MKNKKKLLAVLLAAVMVMAMGIAVYAAPVDTTLKVSAVDGHTYTAYQLFVGDLSTDATTGTKTLSNVKWGANVKPSITYGTETVTATPGGAVPKAVLDYVESLASKTDTDVAQGTANILSDWVTGTGTVITENGITVPTGYYVVKDAYTNPNATQETTLSTVVCEVVGPTTIAPKAGKTHHDKQVLDINDTTDPVLDLSNLQNVDAAKWDKSADHDFGDKVPFKLTTTIGSDFAKYQSYYLSVNDTLCNGLTLDADSIKVFVNGVEATKGPADGNYTVTSAAHSFKVEFTKLNGNTNAAAGKDVVVYYTATLNADGTDVVIGNDGNLNTSYAEFSNNPNDNQDGKGKTPNSTAVVFTYKTDVDKIDEDGDPLANAGFTLYKKYKAAVEGKTNVAGTTPAGAAANTFPAGEFWYEVKTIAASAGTNFEFAGIDDGTYVLVESTTPAGYNTMDPITLIVTATHGADSTSTTGYKITALNVDNENFKAAANGGEITFIKKKGTPKTLASGEIYSEIINEEGSVLPTTGGIGTTIFYVIGAILVLGAGVVLIARRRTDA